MSKKTRDLAIWNCMNESNHAGLWKSEVYAQILSSPKMDFRSVVWACSDRKKRLIIFARKQKCHSGDVVLRVPMSTEIGQIKTLNQLQAVLLESRLMWLYSLTREIRVNVYSMVVITFWEVWFIDQLWKLRTASVTEPPFDLTLEAARSTSHHQMPVKSLCFLVAGR